MQLSSCFGFEMDSLTSWLSVLAFSALRNSLDFQRACSSTILRNEVVRALRVADADIIRFTCLIFPLLGLNQDAVSKFAEGVLFRAGLYCRFTLLEGG